MGPMSIITGIAASLQLLKGAKELLYSDKSLVEALGITSKRVSGNVGSLQEQVREHREAISKLVEEARASQQIIEKHNQVLVQLGEATQQLAANLVKQRRLTWLAAGVAVVSVLVTIALAIFR